jgi:hypothetical protein
MHKPRPRKKPLIQEPLDYLTRGEQPPKGTALIGEQAPLFEDTAPAVDPARKTPQGHARANIYDVA